VFDLSAIADMVGGCAAINVENGAEYEGVVGGEGAEQVENRV